MTWLEQLKNASLIEPLGWTILHSLWQGTAIAIIAAVLLRLTRSHSAQLRYAITCFALFSMLIAAIVTFAALRPTRSSPLATDIAPLRLDGPTIQPTQISGPIPAIHSVVPSLADRIRPILPSLALAWIAGVLLLGAYHAGGWMLLRRLRFQSRTIADVSSRAMLTDLIAAMQIRRTVQLCESVLVQVPTVIGWLSPIILLPASAIIGLSPSELRGLLAHELAHIRRHDYLVNLLQTVIETLLFYHPATWWLGKVIRQERENCCDDLAAAVCDRTIYAQALASMESLRQSPQLALSAKGAALLPRIRRILGLPNSPTRRSLSSGFVSVSILVAVVVGGVLLNACRSNAKTPTTKSDQPTTQPEIAYSDPTASDLIAPPNEPYRIVPLDVVKIVINDLQAKGTQETETKRVNNDGDISLPMIGFVHAAGETESEFEKAIAAKYQDANVLKQAVVSVTVEEGRGRCFQIMGGVDRPGQYAIPKADFRLNDVIALAQGVHPSADTIYIIRNSGQHIIRIPIELLHSDPGHYNVVIYPDDLIQVFPRFPDDQRQPATQPVTINADRVTFKITSKEIWSSYANESDLKPSTRPTSETGIYRIAGLVGRQGQFDIPEGDFRLLNALDQAQGTAASAKSITVCRGDSQKMRLIYISLEQLRDHPEQNNVTIYPNDTIMVGMLTMKSAATAPESRSEDVKTSGETDISNATLADLQSVLHALDLQRQNIQSKLDSSTKSIDPNVHDINMERATLTEIDQERDVVTKQIAAKSDQSHPATTPSADAPINPSTRPVAETTVPEGSVYYVSGVPRTGVYAMGPKRVTLLQALVAAGFDQSLRDKVLTVVHKNGERVPYNINEIVDQNGQMSVEADDVLMVTERGASEIYIGGNDIPRVGVYSMPPKGINLLQAIVMAGGDPAKMTDENVQLRRRVEHDRTDFYAFSMKELAADPSKQLLLQADDQVFVGNHKAASTEDSSELAPGAISIEGDVPKPGQYAINGITYTVLEAIASTGADPSKMDGEYVYLHRPMMPGSFQSMYWPMRELIDDAISGPRVLPGDHIRVAKAKETPKPKMVEPNPNSATEPTAPNLR